MEKIWDNMILCGGKNKLWSAFQDICLFPISVPQSCERLRYKWWLCWVKLCLMFTEWHLRNTFLKNNKHNRTHLLAEQGEINSYTRGKYFHSVNPVWVSYHGDTLMRPWNEEDREPQHSRGSNNSLDMYLIVYVPCQTVGYKSSG